VLFTITLLIFSSILLAALYIIIQRKRGKIGPIWFNFGKLHIDLEKMRNDMNSNFIQFWGGWRRFYFINEPEGVQRVMTTNRDNYPKVSDVRSVLEPALGMGLLCSNGDLWKAHRQIFAFVGHDKFKRAHFPAVIPAIQRFIAKLKEKEQAGEDILLYRAIDDCTTEVMETLVLGMRMPVHIRKALTAMFEELENQVLRFIRWHRFLPSFRRTMRTLDTWLYEQIKERRAYVKAHPDDHGQDALSMACAESNLTDLELRDNTLTLMFAGHDAIALALTFTIYLCSQHPEVMKKLRDEANEVLGDMTAPTYDMLKQFTYAERVFKEGIRFYSPVPAFGHLAVKDDVVCGVKIPAGSSIALSPWCMHRREDIYKNALKFDPDRWLEINPSAYEYMPFAVAPRSCLGKMFALMEASALLPMVFRELEFTPTRTSNPAEVEWKYGLTAQPKNGMWVRAKSVRA